MYIYIYYVYIYIYTICIDLHTVTHSTFCHRLGQSLPYIMIPRSPEVSRSVRPLVVFVGNYLLRSDCYVRFILIIHDFYHFYVRLLPLTPTWPTFWSTLTYGKSPFLMANSTISMAS